MPEQINVELLEQYFEDSADESHEARVRSEKARDYYDNIQLTSDEVATLKGRQQPPVVFNMIAPKVDFLLGTERQSRTDPKAFPRTPEHEDAADAVTDAVRYVLDNNDFDLKASAVFENVLIEGSGGVSVEVRPKGDDIEIVIEMLRWDRRFSDPHSLDKHYADSRYEGVVIWKDLEDAKARWPDKADDLEAGMSTSGLAHDSDTYDDKPQHWWDRRRKRVMCVDIYFMHKQKWHHAIFAQGVFLNEPEVSPYIDEDGLPANPLISFSAKVKRDGQRYGAVEGLIDIQDEINKRRSKALHMLSTRQTFSKEGRITDITKFKKEANKPDGHIEFPNDGEFGKDFGTIPNEQLVGPQFELYLDAKNMMDTVQANAALNGKVEGGLSGKAIQSLQQGGIVELTPLFDAHSQFKKRVYRAVWNRIKQFWTEERWIRVTDNEENLRFVGLNQPVTIAEQRVMDEMGLNLTQTRQQFARELEEVHRRDPALAQIADIQNDVVEMDVDIIIEEVPDVVNLQSEQFDALVAMYQANPAGIPWEKVVEMSTLRNKDKILKKELEPEEQEALAAQQQAEQEAMQLEKDSVDADIASKRARAAKDIADAEAQQIENQAVRQGLIALG